MNICPSGGTTLALGHTTVLTLQQGQVYGWRISPPPFTLVTCLNNTKSVHDACHGGVF